MVCEIAVCRTNGNLERRGDGEEECSDSAAIVHARHPCGQFGTDQRISHCWGACAPDAAVELCTARLVLFHPYAG